jgi:hypothetical protein
VVLLNTHHEERLHAEPAIMEREQVMLVRELDHFLNLVQQQAQQQQQQQQQQHTEAAAAGMLPAGVRPCAVLAYTHRRAVVLAIGGVCCEFAAGHRVSYAASCALCVWPSSSLQSCCWQRTILKQACRLPRTGGCGALLLPEYCQQVFPRYVVQLQQLLAQQARGDAAAADSLGQLVTWRVGLVLRLAPVPLAVAWCQ